jgi:hypothetical protein
MLCYFVNISTIPAGDRIYERHARREVVVGFLSYRSNSVLSIISNPSGPAETDFHLFFHCIIRRLQLAFLLRHEKILRSATCW